MSTTESVSPAPQQQPAPAEQPQKKPSVLKRILTYVVGLIVAAGAIYAFNYFTSDVAQAKVGECASITGTSTKPEYKPVDCGAAEAMYSVAQAGGTDVVCGDNYDEYTQTQRRGPKTKLCLAPVFAEGKCYSENIGGVGLKAVECTESAGFKVTKAGKDAAEPQCAEGETALVYPEVKLNYCTGAPA
ncbi:hypothetical protein SAMN05216553_114155 [Lentzea fradiae]|uniref:Uncharacterized protein n=1 Tax=Lentzea fradiae TaxID=200378 RepID=A0A1G7YV58_9PSEU|nr:hypothetical protein [Lentzea fradiae]SDH00099.1 hypothetical protein SAMN05216553_114155 [Lentzea fradiae]